MDSLVGDMSPDRLFVAFDRASHDVGQEEPEVDCPVFQERFAHHLRNLMVSQSLGELRDKGLAVVVNIADDGAQVWALA